MIVEGILTTESEDGTMHVAPIGPHVDRAMSSWILKPFQTSRTFANLHRQSRAIFHVVDDGLLMVQSVLGICNSPEHAPKAKFEESLGWILQDACRAIPLLVSAWDLQSERATATCTEVESIELKPFWGWNRACNSLLELSILVSRKHLLDEDYLRHQLEHHRVIVQKTAGDRELLGLQLVEQALLHSE